MKIRHADASDAGRIKDIIEQSRFTAENGAGLVDYPAVSEQEYAARIHNNPFFYVTEFNGNAVGFLAAYNDQDIFRLRNDEIAEYIGKKTAPFVYWDVAAIEPEYRGQGITTQLGKQLFADAKQSGHTVIWGAVSRSPLNIAGVELVRKHGFILAETKNFYGHVFGIYRKFL